MSTRYTTVDAQVYFKINTDDVQDTMNKVVKAENEKIAAIDFVTAAETTADGIKRAEKKRKGSSRPKF